MEKFITITLSNKEGTFVRVSIKRIVLYHACIVPRGEGTLIQLENSKLIRVNETVKDIDTMLEHELFISS